MRKLEDWFDKGLEQKLTRREQAGSVVGGTPTTAERDNSDLRRSLRPPNQTLYYCGMCSGSWKGDSNRWSHLRRRRRSEHRIQRSGLPAVRRKIGSGCRRRPMGSAPATSAKLHEGAGE